MKGRAMISHILDIVIMISRHIVAGIKTMAIRSQIQMGAGTKLTDSARIYNLQNSKKAISIGENCIIAGEIFAYAHGGNVRIGDWSYVGRGSRIWSAESIEIGDRVQISHNVNILDANGHPLDPEKRYQHFRAIHSKGHPKDLKEMKSRPIKICDDAWIGFNVIIFGGVTIGERAIIGAGSIIRENVPAGAMIKPVGSGEAT